MNSTTTTPATTTTTTSKSITTAMPNPLDESRIIPFNPGPKGKKIVIEGVLVMSFDSGDIVFLFLLLDCGQIKYEQRKSTQFVNAPETSQVKVS